MLHNKLGFTSKHYHSLLFNPRRHCLVGALDFDGELFHRGFESSLVSGEVSGYRIVE